MVQGAPSVCYEEIPSLDLFVDLSCSFLLVAGLCLAHPVCPEEGRSRYRRLRRGGDPFLSVLVSFGDLQTPFSRGFHNGVTIVIWDRGSTPSPLYSLTTGTDM